MPGRPEIRPGRRKPKPGEKWELLFASQLAQAGIPFEREVTVIPGRKFRHDFRIKGTKILVEIHGQIWKIGGHTSGIGLIRDCDKLNLALLHGFIPLAFTPEHLKDGSAIALIREILKHPSV